MIIRFIPTHVGNTRAIASKSRWMPVHPHARGEHNPDNAAVAGKDGSSPRTWGTLTLVFGWTCRYRFIPTHVGNTLNMAVRAARSPVHPHARGEHWCASNQIQAHAGSSPRTWGTRRSISAIAFLLRFIPTHVGNTTRRNDLMKLLCGSSPRTWGTPHIYFRSKFFARFIPTHVGNTCLRPAF